ncbi:MAG: acyloxyacyl hydrolase [Bacteroidales bacterium]|nr:acyloxyacyl hydrolase [Bacteroidales bacterium]
MRLYFLYFLITVSISSYAQQKKQPWEGKKNYGFFNTIELHSAHGVFLKNSSQLDEIMDNPYSDLALRIGIQSTGEELWEQILGYPIYGMGFYNAHFYNSDPLGSPAAIYLFINAPIKRWDRFSIKWELAAGLSYGFHPHDSVENPDNNVIGSKKNVYFHGKVIAEYKINERWDFGLGGGFNHFSNGSTQTPNLGINLVGITLNARYNFNAVKSLTKNIDPNYQPQIRPDFVPKKIPKTKTQHELSIYYAAGGKATTTQYTDGPIYFISALSADYHYKYYHIAQIGFGFDYFYEAALKDYQNIEDPSFSDLTYTGFHLSHILYFDKLALIFQPGIYISNNVKHKTNTYMRVGGRYDVTDKFFIQVALKTRNGATADFIEWGLGYKFIYKN